MNDDEKIFQWAVKQTYIMIGNMMTAAAEIKIDSCAIEGFNIDAITEILKKGFNVDDSKFGILLRLNNPEYIKSVKTQISFTQHAD